MPSLKKKKFQLSNEQVSDLARLWTGQFLANKQAQYVIAGYRHDIGKLMSDAEKSFGIDTENYNVDWNSALKDGWVYVTPKPPEKKVVAETGQEEKKPEDVGSKEQK